MKHFLTSITIFFSVFVYAQEKTIELDYIVDYLIENKKSQTKDTMSIGFSEDGKYLWTDYKALADDFSKSVFNNRPSSNDSKINIILDTETADLLFTFKNDDSNILFNVNAKSLLSGSEDNNSSEKFILTSTKSNNTVDVMNSEYYVYEIYPDNQPNDIVYICFDEKFNLDNNNMLKRFFQIIVGQDSQNSMQFDLPKGIILKVNDGNKDLIEAIKINTRKKTININYSIKVTE